MNQWWKLLKQDVTSCVIERKSPTGRDHLVPIIAVTDNTICIFVRIEDQYWLSLSVAFIRSRFFLKRSCIMPSPALVPSCQVPIHLSIGSMPSA